jgi:hypothetical protein
MGLDTQAVRKGHLAVDDICARLLSAYGTKNASARATRSPNYWLVEFADRDGEHRVLNVFLNSYAADDYRELHASESTFITMELGPTSEAVIKALSQGSEGWVRQHDSGPWTPLDLGGA